MADGEVLSFVKKAVFERRINENEEIERALPILEQSVTIVPVSNTRPKPVESRVLGTPELSPVELPDREVRMSQTKSAFQFIDENPPPYVANALIYNIDTHKQEEADIEIFRAEKAEQAVTIHTLLLHPPRARHDQHPEELPFVINKIRKTEKEGICMDTMVSLFGTPSSSSDDEIKPTVDSIKPTVDSIKPTVVTDEL